MSRVAEARKALIYAIRMHMPVHDSVSKEADVAINKAMDDLQAATIAEAQVPGAVPPLTRDGTRPLTAEEIAALPNNDPRKSAGLASGAAVSDGGAALNPLDDHNTTQGTREGVAGTVRQGDHDGHAPTRQAPQAERVAVPPPAAAPAPSAADPKGKGANARK